MNSTGRGGRHLGRVVGGYRAKPSGENPHDFFPTPPEVTKAFWEAVGPSLPDGLWCEPAVGDGHIINAVGPREAWATYDIRDVPAPALSVLHYPSTDWLSLPLPSTGRAGVDHEASYEVIITNPPFYLAEEFVRASLARATHVVMLLRLAFLETRKREDLHKEFPSDVYVLSRRPSFMANGATDSCAYAWFVWGPGRGGRWEILETPKTTRKKA